MADELGERTEAPTEHRLREARNKGQLPKSQDLSAVVAMVGAVIAVLVFGGSIGTGVGTYMRRTLDLSDGASPLAVEAVFETVVDAMIVAGEACWPSFLMLALLALVGQVTQVGLLFTTKPLEPNINRLNPISGIKKQFSKRNLVKTVVNIAKLIVVILVTWLVTRTQIDRIAALVTMPLWSGVDQVARLVLELSLWLLLLLAVLGLIDWIFQKWQHKQENKMTKQQVKDERKGMEGDVEMRGRRQQMGRQLIMQQVNAAVPNADVVITNPTHFSVAIRYDAETMQAPRVIAKGADLIAFRIRQLARVGGVPVVERPPLARALYAGVDVGQEISAEHFQAVAEVLAYVYRLDEQAAA